jgi:hypothetical protein
MGLIYKITNTVNGKCYVGQTIKSADRRWAEHKRFYLGNHPTQKSKRLYVAMREFGVENFTFEVLQDNIKTQQELDAAEIAWINQCDGYISGYNARLGGRHTNYALPNDRIINSYIRTRSFGKTAKEFGIDRDTVERIVNAGGVAHFSFRQAAGKRVIVKKGSLIKEFDSIRDCSEWFMATGLTKTKKIESVRTSVRTALKSGGLYYGYEIKKVGEQDIVCPDR